MIVPIVFMIICAIVFFMCLFPFQIFLYIYRDR
jgi:phosphotransferase system  glucose/maltose/N-acetylglucosamine-specific IIC component